MTNKLDQASVEILRYTYDADGRLTNRWSKAKNNTAYAYDTVGNLTTVNYPVSTDTTLSYDALNRVTNMVDAAGTTKLTYTAAGDLATEDGPWTSDTVTYTYHSRVPHLRTAVSLQQATGSWTNGLSYDAAKRLSSLTSQAGTFSYSYKGAGNLWTNLALPNTAAITNAYDTTARLTGTYLKNSGGTILNKHLYAYNTAHQRTTHTRTDGSYVTFGYDNISQLKTAVGSGGQSTENLGYLYDTAWNLNKRTNNGAVSTFTVNVKNELTSEPGYTDTYDNNGNLTSRTDGGYNVAYSYAYDDENQLTSVRYQSSLVSSSYWWRMDYVYDGRQRVRMRTDYTWLDGYGWYQGGQTRCLYDGMVVIQERGPTNPTISYARGLDLSGTLQGAGGIGGLLSRSRHATTSPYAINGTSYYHADGNGNVTYLAGSTGSADAAYKFDPFGRTLASTGTYASANVYRFSSKEIHVKSGMYYYGYRFYDPNVQRWLNRDPIGETGFETLRRPIRARPLRMLRAGEPNRYRFARNNSVSVTDANGLYGWMFTDAFGNRLPQPCPPKPCTPDPNYNYDQSWTMGLYEGGVTAIEWAERASDVLNGMPTPAGVPPDKWRHCTMTCLIFRDWGPIPALGAAAVTEIPFIGGGRSEWGDFLANLTGVAEFLNPFDRNCLRKCACAARNIK